jgi:hypothetical protein
MSTCVIVEAEKTMELLKDNVSAISEQAQVRLIKSHLKANEDLASLQSG